LKGTVLFIENCRGLVAAVSDRQSFWLQNQNEQMCIRNMYFNQWYNNKIINRVKLEPISQSARLAFTERRYKLIPIFITSKRQKSMLYSS